MANFYQLSMWARTSAHSKAPEGYSSLVRVLIYFSWSSLKFEAINSGTPFSLQEEIRKYKVLGAFSHLFQREARINREKKLNFTDSCFSPPPGKLGIISAFLWVFIYHISRENTFSSHFPFLLLVLLFKKEGNIDTYEQNSSMLYLPDRTLCCIRTLKSVYQRLYACQKRRSSKFEALKVQNVWLSSTEQNVVRIIF